MNPPCSSTQLATRCFKQVVERPKLFVLPWLVATITQLTSAVFFWPQDVTQDVTSMGLFMRLGLFVTWICLALAYYAAQMALACAAARGLPWRQQLQVLRCRLRPIVGCLLRYQGFFLWHTGQRLAACWAITGGVAAGAYFRLWRWPNIGIGAFPTLAAVAALQLVVCLLWGACVAETRLLLARALVLQGASAAEAIRVSQERSSGLQAWLLKAVALTNLPSFCLGLAAGYIAVLAPHLINSGAAFVVVQVVYIILIPLIPIPASLPMIALMALTPKPPASQEIALAA